MPRVFISYRRADSSMAAGRIHDRLISAFGPNSIFMDVDRIPPGVDFREYINAEVENADVMLVLIGQQWLNIADEAGTRRLDNPADFVHIEVEAGLNQLDCVVIPVLLGNTPMPQADDLPSDLQDLAYRNAVPVRDNPDFNRDVERLIRWLRSMDADLAHIQKEMAGKTRRSRAFWAIGIVAITAILAAIIIVILNITSGENDGGSANETSTPKDTQVAVANTSESTNAAQPTGTPTENPTVTLTPTERSTLTETATLTSTGTPTLSATEFEHTIQAEMDLSLTENAQTVNAIETQTAVAQTSTVHTAVALAVETSEALTMTATHWTQIPTPDARGTANARLTATQLALITQATANAYATGTQLAYDQTTTATMWTNTPTITYTPSTTNTPSSTPVNTPIPTATYTPASTPTLTPSENPTDTPTTATLTPTVTPTPPPTPTNTPDLLQAALDRARNFSGGNDDWEPFVNEFDGVEMVLVPVGCFEMGTTDFSNTQPIHQVCFDEPFWIDRYEVTNELFGAFDGQAEGISYFSGDDLPRDQVNWKESSIFCESRNARLPTEAEWEYAARGPDGWNYPWGNEFNCHIVNTKIEDGEDCDEFQSVSPVGSFPEGESWSGALDMSGNMWEWTSTIFQNYPYQMNDGRESTDVDNGERVARGGSWIDGYTIDVFRSAYRNHIEPLWIEASFGFRCARSVDTSTINTALLDIPASLTSSESNAEPATIESAEDAEPCLITAKNSSAEVRLGPGFTRGILGYLPLDQTFTATGQKTMDDNTIWWQIEYGDRDEAWIWDNQIETAGGCEYVIAVDAPPVVFGDPKPEPGNDNSTDLPSENNGQTQTLNGTINPWDSERINIPVTLTGTNVVLDLTVTFGQFVSSDQCSSAAIILGYGVINVWPEYPSGSAKFTVPNAGQYNLAINISKSCLSEAIYTVAITTY